MLGSETIRPAEGVTLDSDGGHVVLRGAPTVSRVAGAGAMAADFEPADMRLDAAATDDLVQWLAADNDGDAGLLSLTLGDATAQTTVTSPSIWNGLTGTTVLLRGSSVQLGEVGSPAWSLDDGAVLRATGAICACRWT